MAIEAFAPDMTCSQGGRDFWPGSGLVPKQQSTGGKSRLGKVSEMGQVDTRSQRIPGAMSGITAATRFGMKKGGVAGTSAWAQTQTCGRGHTCQQNGAGGLGDDDAR